MEEKRTLFVVSDIHGHYTQLKAALDAAGFDENRQDHVLLCCGDLFDRGGENVTVYHYIRRLPRKILVRGNHDERLATVLRTGRVERYDERNGGLMTLREFFGPGCVSADGRLRIDHRLLESAWELLQLEGQMVDYYETEHYVFTHGWLPLEADGNVSRIRPDWRDAEPEAWHAARYAEWQLLYHTPAKLPDKTIVCGHRTSRYGHFFDPERAAEDYGIFHGNGVIAIDACTALSGQVNVLVLAGE